MDVEWVRLNYNYVHSLLAANVASKVISEESLRTGIGLVNVNNRLVLYYGKESGITIESEEGKGTKVSFRIKREKVVPDESFDNWWWGKYTFFAM